MSLQVGDSGRRARSRSPGRRAADDDDDRDDYRERDRSRTRGAPVIAEAKPYPEDRDRNPGSASYEYERLASYRPASPVGDYYRSSRDRVDEDVRIRSGDSRREKEYRYEEKRTSERPRDRDRDRDSDSDHRRGKDRDGGAARPDPMAFLPQKYAQKIAEPESPRASRGSLRDMERDPDLDRERDRRERDRRRDKDDDDLAYGETKKYARPESPPSSYAYAKPKQWEYEKPEEKVPYGREDGRRASAQPSTLQDPRASGAIIRAASPGARFESSKDKDRERDRDDRDKDRERDREREREPKKYSRSSLSSDPRGSSASVVTIEPGAGPRKSAMKRDASPQPPTARMSSLMVNTGHVAAVSLAAAPGSPLLESYHGTYQSMSPMPSPLLLPTGGSGHGPEIMEALSPIGSDDERGAEKRRSRRARFHDPVDDAARLAKALKGEKRAPDTEPLIEILPGLTHDQVMELRTEYKRLVKTGSDRKGVNIAKHIRARLKDEDPSLMKACYAVALGRWESEAYWANFWYQGDKTRRELLIESLMGRTNDEIRHIKEGFSDKKYDNSLTKCMRTELKEDKFKKAVLIVLEEQRMEETDAYGRPLRIDHDLVKDDVKELHHAVKSEKGGESLMISIVVSRSDTHLKEVLRVYTEQYGKNFAREALKKSGNLVGELLAHILNGVINKPVRDALLLHHAVSSTKKDELRKELLTSRLVRYHWDRQHMAAVKIAYRERYGKDLLEVVREATSGEWGEFCTQLCISRMPDDVRRVERVEVIKR